MQAFINRLEGFKFFIIFVCIVMTATFFIVAFSTVTTNARINNTINCVERYGIEREFDCRSKYRTLFNDISFKGD